MLDIIDLTDWKTKAEIIAELAAHGWKINERTWRLYVEAYNAKYWNHEVESYIVHGQHGYKLTSDKDEIKASIADLKKRGLNMLWKHSRTMRAIGEKDNLRLDLEEKGII